MERNTISDVCNTPHNGASSGDCATLARQKAVRARYISHSACTLRARLGRNVARWVFWLVVRAAVRGVRGPGLLVTLTEVYLDNVGGGARSATLVTIV